MSRSRKALGRQLETLSRESANLSSGSASEVAQIDKLAQEMHKVLTSEGNPPPGFLRPSTLALRCNADPHSRFCEGYATRVKLIMQDGKCVNAMVCLPCWNAHQSAIRSIEHVMARIIAGGKLG